MYQKKYWAMSSKDVLDQFNSSEKGLSEYQVNELQAQYGFNEIAKPKIRTSFFVLLSQFKNPLILLLMGASIVAAFLGDLTDTVIIIGIVFLNGFLGFFQEYRSEKALERLRTYVKFNARVIRESERRQIDIKELVPGDIVLLETGDVVPADMRFLDINELFIDESALTGESYPVRKQFQETSVESPAIHELKNIAFMGTYVRTGEGIGVIVATGKNTYLGKTAQLLKKIKRESEFQKDLKSLSYTLLRIVLASVVLIFIINVIFIRDILSIILFALALAVGMIPEALPIIITITLSSGALLLAKKDVIVKRLVSVEDLGNIDVICTDKTGTITENKLTLEKYMNVNGNPMDKLILYSLLCNSIKKESNTGNPLDMAIWNYAKKQFDTKKLEEYSIIKEFPFDSNRKRMSVVVRTNKTIFISKGAPEYIIDFSTHVWQNDEVLLLADKESARKLYEEYGSKGYRVIAVAFKEIEEKENYNLDDEFGLTLLGYIAFMDPPKESAKEAIKLSKDLGIEFKILTGDGPYVSKEIARLVGLDLTDEEIMLGQELDKITDIELQEKVKKVVVFCRATPEHKYRVVKALRKNGRITACLGDGVNDAPALKEADVGIAVDQGSDIAKDVADIILLQKSLKVIVDGVIEGRRIFGNIVKYLLYTVSGNFGNLFTVGGASTVLRFLPLLPAQLILSNFLTDAPTIAVSTDNVEKEELIRPKRWDTNYIFKFGGLLGIVSSVFDIVFILLLLFVFNVNNELFRTALFAEIILSEVCVLFMIRTNKLFLKGTPPSKLLAWASLFTLLVTFALIYLPINSLFEFIWLPLVILGTLILVVFGYVMATELVKLTYYKKAKKPKIKPMSMINPL